ncbi:hypothetical protein P154DRAFT_526286 [Amniculicola lignicola CBS 123094]|uniref:F-box domain-containing protein n=1 Tax=Amniculicola lignicola CBS 123094 TaxID=1392246 RepID=A0A6A5W134_9PLEO|nr:hypothetical protein P154DRAFT_526286 [Amniculicola lignicola CBS 123094]
MDRAPQELVDQICGYLDSEDLRRVYYVSTKFRNAAEHHAKKFRKCTEEITDETKKNFINQYSGFRLRYLSKVQFWPEFPDLVVDDSNGCRESLEEQREKDKIFTKQIQELFSILKTVEDGAGERNRGEYRLVIYSPFQKRINHDTPTRYPCLHREHDYWRTHLLEPKALPELISVTCLALDDDQESSYSHAKLDYRIMIDLAARLPMLESLRCKTGRDEWTPAYENEPLKDIPWEYDGPRRDTRHDFHKAITTTNLPQTLQSVVLNFFCREAMEPADDLDQRKSMPDLVGPALKDPFSSSLRVLSYHLHDLTLIAQVDETLFWPGDGSVPHWPHLERIYVMFHMVSPSGTWYFEGPKGEGRELAGHEVNQSSYPPLKSTVEDKEDDETAACEVDRFYKDTAGYSFRISPNDKVLVPFLVNFAKAATNMPRLKQAILWSPLTWDTGELDGEVNPLQYFDPPYIPNSGDCYAWGLAYYEPGEFSSLTPNPNDHLEGFDRKFTCENRSIWWKVGKWRPNAATHELFQGIGRQKHGEALTEFWDEDKSGQGYASRYDFEWEYWTPEEY